MKMYMYLPVATELQPKSAGDDRVESQIKNLISNMPSLNGGPEYTIC